MLQLGNGKECLGPLKTRRSFLNVSSSITYLKGMFVDWEEPNKQNHQNQVDFKNRILTFLILLKSISYQI